MGWLKIMDVKAIAEKALNTALEAGASAAEQAYEVAKNVDAGAIVDRVKGSASDAIDSTKQAIHKATAPSEK